MKTNKSSLPPFGFSRRQFLAGSAALLAAGALGGVPVPASRRKCRPVISGSLWWYKTPETARWGVDDWKEELDRQTAIGFDLAWICNTPMALAGSEDASLFLKIMDLCAARKMKVILGTGMSPGWYRAWDIKQELALCAGAIAVISSHLKDHPAFGAWYIPHEIYMAWDKADAYIQQLYPALVERCKQAANLPVTVSPFFILDRDHVFGAFRFNEPDEYSDYWAALIRKSGMDVVMLQDSGEHFSYVTNDMRRPFFEAMSRACREGGAKFWGNVEMGECEFSSKDEYVERHGRVPLSAVKNAPWRAVPIERLRDKLDLASEHGERIVTWGYQEYGRPALGVKARKWYADYLDYVNSQL